MFGLTEITFSSSHVKFQNLPGPNFNMNQCLLKADTLLYTLYIAWQDTLLSLCLSPPKCIEWVPTNLKWDYDQNFTP